MAWSYDATRGSATSKAANSLGVAPNATIAVGKVVLVRLVSDNFITTSGATSDHTVSDDAGNTYTLLSEYTQTGGSTQDGVTMSMWVTQVTAQLTTGNTVTGASSAGPGIPLTGAIAITLEQYAIGAGSTISVIGNNGQASTGTGPSVTLNVSSGNYLWVSQTGAEGPIGDTYTDDADNTVTWSNRGTTGGSAVSNVAMKGGTREFNGSSDTYAPTLGTSRDFAAVYAAVKEIAAASGPPPPFKLRERTTVRM